MTEHVSGYRTFAQAGASVPAAPAPTPEAVEPPRPSATTEFDARPRDNAEYEGDLASIVKQQSDGTWAVSFTPLDLPSPDRVTDLARRGLEQGELLHPRSNGNRLPTQTTHPADPSSPASDAGLREGSLLVSAGMVAGAGLNVVQAARVLGKVPQMMRTDSLSRLPDLLVTGPDRTILDPTIKRSTIAPNGMSYTKFDDWALRSVAWFSPLMAAYQFGTGGWAVGSTLWHGDASDLTETRQGRSGVLQTAGGVFGLGVLGLAVRQTRGLPVPLTEGGTRGSAVSLSKGDARGLSAPPGAGIASGLRRASERVVAIGKAPASLSPTLIKIGVASGLFVAANQFGYFDMLNRNDARRLGTKLHDAVRETPITNDTVLRPLAFAGVTGIVGWKSWGAVRDSLRASGAHDGAALLTAARAIPRGKQIGIVGSALVVGASLAGGMTWFDKRG